MENKTFSATQPQMYKITTNNRNHFCSANNNMLLRFKFTL